MTPISILNKLSHDWTLYIFFSDVMLPDKSEQIMQDYVRLLEDEQRHIEQQWSGTEDYHYNEMYNM